MNTSDEVGSTDAAQDSQLGFIFSMTAKRYHAIRGEKSSRAVSSVLATVKDADNIAGRVAQVRLAPQPALVNGTRVDRQAFSAQLHNFRIDILHFVMLPG